MRVVHLSLSDNRGGAACAAYRIHQALLADNIDSRMFVRIKASTDEAVEPYQPAKDFWSRLKRVRRRIGVVRRVSRYHKTRPPGPFIFHARSSELGRDLMGDLPEADLLNLHWVSTFVDFAAFFRAVGGRVPVVWTLHDMNPFTGGCHYSTGCDGYLRQCGRCPWLGSDNPRDLSHKTWRRKKRALQRVPTDMLHIVSPSRWLGEQAKASSLFGRFPVHVLPNCLDTDVFEPRDRLVATQALDIPADAKVVLFAAANPEMPRKGFNLLVEAIGRVDESDRPMLLTLGQGSPTVSDTLAHKHVGAIHDERLLTLIYSAADVLACPSLEDNLPNTVLESMACGTPAVGFNVGGIGDMVRPDSTGLLAPAGDTGALSEAVRSLLSDPDRLGRMGRESREVAVREYSQKAGARRYAELYKDMQSGRGSGQAIGK
ncbi:MAG: glycosyltransferase family 4 protein [Planctomycetota bacterium]